MERQLWRYDAETRGPETPGGKRYGTDDLTNDLPVDEMEAGRQKLRKFRNTQICMREAGEERNGGPESLVQEQPQKQGMIQWIRGGIVRTFDALMDADGSLEEEDPKRGRRKETSESEDCAGEPPAMCDSEPDETKPMASTKE